MVVPAPPVLPDVAPVVPPVEADVLVGPLPDGLELLLQPAIRQTAAAAMISFVDLDMITPR
jgi:hypothetical protein